MPSQQGNVSVIDFKNFSIPSSRRVNVVGKVVVLGEPKEIKTRFGEDKSVSEVIVADDTGFEHKGIKSAKPAHILNGAGRSCILLFEPEPEVALC